MYWPHIVKRVHYYYMQIQENGQDNLCRFYYDCFPITSSLTDIDYRVVDKKKSDPNWARSFASGVLIGFIVVVLRYTFLRSGHGPPREQELFPAPVQ